MKKGEVEKILVDKTEQLAKLTAAIAPEFSEDHVHQFRVAVKRLRSFLRLLNTHTSKPGLKISRKVKRLYHIAGEIREAQLEQKKIHDLKLALPAYELNLQKLMSKQAALWNKYYKQKTIEKLKEKLTGAKLPELEPGQLNKFIEKRIQELEKIKDGELSNEQIHAHRKQVKDILYNIKLAEKDWKKGYSSLTAVPIKELDALADTIGKYNDERIILDHFIAFSSKKEMLPEQEVMHRVCSDGIKMQVPQKRKLQQSIKKFLKLQ